MFPLNFIIPPFAEFVSPAAEAIPAGKSCAKPKNENHQRALWAVCQGYSSHC